MSFRMLDQPRTDPGGADARIDHERPEQSMAAEQLQTYKPDSGLWRAGHEEVLQMRVGQILGGKIGGLQQRNGSGKRWSASDRDSVHGMAQAAAFALRAFPAADGAHGMHAVALPQQFSVRYATSAFIALKSAE